MSLKWFVSNRFVWSTISLNEIIIAQKCVSAVMNLSFRLAGVRDMNTAKQKSDKLKAMSSFFIFPRK